MLALAALTCAWLQGTAQDPPQELAELVVTGRAEVLLEAADAAAQGLVEAAEIEARPWLRTGELLEVVPGVIVTQHSGTGKANQYFLRGFNLDHGTDFALSYDGMPVNLPSHGHGQGYADLNFVIPELVAAVEYRKGPYYPSAGDFASAGAAALRSFDALPYGFAKFGAGDDAFGRLVVADSPALGNGRLLYGFAAEHGDGPWQRPENAVKFNALLKYSAGDARDGWSLQPMLYSGAWDATDQVPQRAVDSGALSPLSTLDRSDGGESSRLALIGNWWRGGGDSMTRANAYLSYYRLDLFSNFTYFLHDPVRGDQFEQVDRRLVGGGGLSHELDGAWFGAETAHTVGLQARLDYVPVVGLYATRARQRLSTVREDRVRESSLGLYYENRTQWIDGLRSLAGLRADAYSFDVGNRTGGSSGGENDAILSPKLGLIAGPWADTEFYANAGLGFHSNDARGVTAAVAAADPLVRSAGGELGLRSAPLDGWNTTLSLWLLELDSELLFVGDAGTTAASRPSRRHGLEWANFYAVADWLTLDADVSLSRARFTDPDPAGDRVPGAIEAVVAAGATVEDPSGLFGSLRLRHFGPRALVEDDTVRSSASTLLNLRAGYHAARWSLYLDVLNLLNSAGHDIDYYYASRLPGEPAAGVEDVHFHPVEPRSFRVYLELRF